jgi:hypothetical protein
MPVRDDAFSRDRGHDNVLLGQGCHTHRGAVIWGHGAIVE